MGLLKRLRDCQEISRNCSHDAGIEDARGSRLPVALLDAIPSRTTRDVFTCYVALLKIVLPIWYGTTLAVERIGEEGNH